MCDKKILRGRFRQIRAAAHSEEADRQILSHILHSPFWNAERFFVYHAVGTEAGTRGLIAALRAAGKQVCLPRIEGGVMLAAAYGELTQGAYGIPAPRTGADMPCDVAFTPLLAVDRSGYRLGYGGGFYDAYFAAHPSVLRIGLCYAAQQTDKLPREPQDVPLHALVTENGIVHFNA